MTTTKKVFQRQETSEEFYKYRQNFRKKFGRLPELEGHIPAPGKAL